MNVIELRKELIDRITASTDFDLLNSIRTILDFKNKEPFLYLTSEEEEELLNASVEAKDGGIVYQSDMDKKVDEWLKEN
jgi:hypothetical protein